MTRNYWILLGAFLVLLLVVFGRNPAQQFVKDRPKRAGDRLMQNIQDYSSQPHFDLLPDGSQPAPTPFQDQNGQNPYVNANPYKTPPRQNYRPPTSPAQAQPGKPQSNLFPFGIPRGFYLNNGQKITFAGADVYTINAQGQKVHLADGVYPMFGGAINMVVRGGKKVILTN